jgi:hypothetical protein
MAGGDQDPDVDQLPSHVFYELIHLNHRLEYIMDRTLEADDLTCKQWLTIAMIESFSEAPTIKMVAARMGTTRQNISPIGRHLERKGFITMERDPSDRRKVTFFSSFCAFFNNCSGVMDSYGVASSAMRLRPRPGTG